MAQVIVTLRIMPESPDSDLSAIETAAIRCIAEFGGDVGRKEREPVAFGLNAIKLLFLMDEDIGSTEDLENEILKLKDVSSVDVTDVRRAVG